MASTPCVHLLLSTRSAVQWGTLFCLESLLSDHDPVMLPTMNLTMTENMGLRMRKTTILISNQVQHKPACSHMQAILLKFWIYEEQGFYCLCSENKDADQLCSISCAVTAQLICVFVFAFADWWFSGAAAHIILCRQHLDFQCLL